jgi:hypothetical protein
MYFLHLFTLCSARVSALVIVLSDSQCERIGKWETCPILKQIIGARLAGASVTKTSTLLVLGVSRATVSKVSNIVVQYSFGPIITLRGRITAREYVVRLGNQVRPTIQTLFETTMQFFQTIMPPFTQLKLFSPGLKNMVNFIIFPGQHNHQI